jgi:hypothetical protein
VSLKKPANPKEQNLLKGAIRRVFSRSELRREALESTRIEHHDPLRPRVTKWSWCTECGIIEPTYLMEVDHEEPLIPLDKSLATMTWNEVIERTWCDLANLKPKCKPCHREKSRLEMKERRRLKKEGSK